MYGVPSGAYYGPHGRYRTHPKERPGTRVRVVENDDIVFKDKVGMVGTAVRRNGCGWLVYFDDYIDLNVPASCLARVPVITDNAEADHLFVRRNRCT